MRQFDICRLKPVGGSGRSTNLVVVLQADLNLDLATRVVAPLVAEDALRAIGQMRPTIHHGGRRYRLIADRLSVLACASIGARVGTCAEHEWEIRRELDIVFVGV